MRPDNRYPKEFEETVVSINRVSKKTKGGSSISFSALVVIGDKKSRVGTGYGKALDVSTAVQKGILKAKKNLVSINMKDSTIAHEVRANYGSASVLLMPAPKGSGIIAGGSVRTVVELAGLKDISSKMLGSNNKIANVRCTIKALSKLK